MVGHPTMRRAENGGWTMFCPECVASWDVEMATVMLAAGKSPEQCVLEAIRDRRVAGEIEMHLQVHRKKRGETWR